MGSFQEDVTVYVNDLGPAAADALREMAQKVRSDVETEQSARRGIRPLTHIAVDGSLTESFDGIKPNSVVVEYWDYRSEIIYAAFQECVMRAPVQSGRYRKSFVALLDGQGLDPMQIPSAEQLAGVREIIITNTVPYARRLEVGVTESGRPFVKQVEPHIMESAMQAVRREFSSVAKIEFGFTDLANAYTARTNFSLRRSKSRRRADRGKGIDIQYPAIFIDQA